MTARLPDWYPVSSLLQVREVDTTVASITGCLQDRQRKYSIHCSKLASVREVRGRKIWENFFTRIIGY